MDRMGSGLTRRSFLKDAALAGAAGTVAISGVQTASASEVGSAVDITWDEECDVLIMGTGAGGLSAAITAADAGGDVLVIEKASEDDQGGNTRVSGNLWTIATDADKGFEYYQAECEGNTDDEYLRKLADDESVMNDDGGFMDTLDDMYITEFVLFSPEQPGLPGSDGIQCYMNEEPGTGKLWASLYSTASGYDNIKFAYETPGTRLITDADGCVIGAVASPKSGDVNIKAKKGVIIATGGYEFNYNMIQNSYPGWPVYSRGTPYNTGDGIKMAQAIGADLWHMNASDSGATCMKCPGLDFGGDAYDSDDVTTQLSFPTTVPWIKVNKHGARFMAEDRAERHGFGHREYVFWYDGVNCEWPNLPHWTVFDDTTAKNAPIAKGANEDALTTLTWFAAHSNYEWSADNSAEVDKGWILKADTVEELADQMNAVDGGEGKMDAATLAATIEAYNADATAGEDTAFGRVEGLLPLATPPYYAVLSYPTQYNTQGGPKRNTDAQTLDVNGDPIPRLYNVGECGACWAWVYNGGSNNAEAMTTGRWAGTHVMTLENWDA